ncbi:hypothetical protein KI688_003003 [Linnemannia hyalina]|uniref:Uncharacterized protein n=1 Tax=Linnemannia hyalina TaxID=64524 RepID=A0A9P7XPM2_9FUNG|nr:hypothetical protein KI688_003003 [Linnemannia hyalina]
MATHIYPQWFHRVQKLFFIVAVALLITLPVLYGHHKIGLTSTEVIVIGVRLCISSVVIESTLPVHTHVPEPTVFLHDPASSRTAVPTTSALKSSSISTTAHPLRAIDTLEHRLSQEQNEEQEEEDQNIEQLKKKLAQDITFSSSTDTAPVATVATASPPPTVTRTARFAEEEQIDDDMNRRQQGRRRQGNDKNIALDQLSSLTPPTSSAPRRGYVSTPSSPISFPTALYPPPLPIPSSSSNSSSPRGVSFQSAPLKRSSTETRHGRSNSSSAAATGVRFQRVLGSPSFGASEEEDEDSLESGYPTFASYRQAQHTHFDAFAQRMRRTLETAATTNAAAATTEVSSPSPLYEQSVPNPTAETLETPHTSDTSTRQELSSQPPKYT